MSYKSIYTYIFFQFFVLPFAVGQSLAIKHLDFQNGLSNNSVLSLYQDSKGFVWVGTYNGLNRYDGYDVKIFRNEIGNRGSLPHNSIYSISEDGQGDIWLAGRKGVSVLGHTTSQFTKVSFTAAHSNPAPLTGNIHKILRLREDKMAVASENYGLVLFNNKRSGTAIPIQTATGLSYAYDAKTVVDDTLNNKIWFWVENKGLFCLDRDKHIAYLKCDLIKNVSTIFQQKNDIWIGTIEGLFCYDIIANTVSANMLSSKLSVVSLTMVNEKLWIGSDGQGLFYLSENDPLRRVIAFDDTDKLKSNSIFSLMKDWNNNLWVGTLRGGCNILYNENSYYSLLKLPSMHQSLADNFIFSFCEDNKGNVWIGTDGAGLKYWDRKKNAFLSYKKEAHQIGGNFITGIVQDGAEHVWLSIWYNGINRFDIPTGQYKQYKLYNKVKDRTEKNTWFVYRDTRSTLWASTTNNGTLYQYDPLIDSFYVFDGRLENIQVMHEDKDGRLWAGDYNNLILLDRTKHHHLFYKINYPVRSILDDSRGFLWVGTEGGGLLVIDKKTMRYKRYSTMDGLPDNAVLRLQNDGNGNIWLSTFSGLASISISDRTVKRLPVDNPEKRNQFSYNAGAVLSDGTLLFGGINGISVLHPKNQPQERNDNHPISLAGISINNTADISPYIDSSRSGYLHLKIPYTNNALSIAFSSPEFLSPDQIQYSYKLDNWDRDWSRPSNNRNVNYSKLSPGIYTFEVKNSNAYNQWDQPSTLVVLTVLPPWYATWWAYFLYVAVGITGIIVYVQYVKYRQRMQYEIRIAHLEAQQESERNERKLSFFTHISHELRTPLTLILNPLKSTLKNIAPYNSVGTNDLHIAYKNARRMLALVDQLMLFRKADENADSLKKSSFRIDALISEVCGCFESLAKEKNITFTYECRYVHSDYVEADKEKLEIILFNLLSNAFKYTGNNGNIKVLGQIHHMQECIIEVEDDGKGIPAKIGAQIFEKFKQTEHSKSGFGIGLYLVRHFVQLHGGDIHYRSVPNKQTLFSARLPIAVPHPIESITQEEASEASFENINLGSLLLDEIIPVPFSDKQNEKFTCDDMITEKRKILIVEDEEPMREYLYQLFKEDYIVRTAINGEVAGKILEKELPDLVISDVQMEPMDGVTLCAIIKNTEKTAHIPVILLTSSVSEETQIKGMNAGADNYVTKPFDNEVLKIKVRGVLENRSKLQQYFFNKVTLRDDQIDNSRIPHEYREFMQQCIQIVENNLDCDDFDIKKFCKAIGMSHSALYKKVKNVSGQTVNRFIRSIRLRQAAVLMLKENYSISQAAFQVGIGDIKYFREQFKALFGMNPSEYIKRYRSNFHKAYHKVPTEADD
ncbi:MULTISPECIES: hybrid sensor histidine kinase/response regulator transcription factor [Chitinophagaceae]